MNTERLASLFRQISDLLSTDVKADIVALSDLLAEVPAENAKTLCGQLRDLLRSQRDSVPGLLARIRRFRQGQGEPIESLRKSIESMHAGPLKQLARALGLSTGGRKGDQAGRVLASLSGAERATEFSAGGGPADAASRSGESGARPSVSAGRSANVDELVTSYRQLAADAKHLSYEEIDRRFAGISEQSATAVSALAAALGYPTSAGKSETLALLRRPLLKIREAQDRGAVVERIR